LKIFLNHSLQIIDQQAYCSRKTITVYQIIMLSC